MLIGWRIRTREFKNDTGVTQFVTEFVTFVPFEDGFAISWFQSQIRRVSFDLKAINLSGGA